ncbi:hypothetical protein GN958_ATG07866 [Phytophthora infestans]|uniref:Uncharacterized protein n=1 Tax=Phytophthora infestans TaxID=4787 RepID=A0A8S9UQE6_PHYIN|nr:hypothetical protein GN958_ATG07866 [Phytophthora infestans]
MLDVAEGNENQGKYTRLSTANFVESLHLFLYVANATPAATSADFHHAMEKRVQQARLQRLAHEAASAVSFGPIASHHLDMINARRPDSATFHVPDDNTTRQAIDSKKKLTGIYHDFTSVAPTQPNLEDEDQKEGDDIDEDIEDIEVGFNVEHWV